MSDSLQHNNGTSSPLALDDGPPAVPDHLIAHDWERFRKATPEEIDAVVTVLKSGHFSIAQGSGMPNAEGLEKEFSEYVGADYCLAVNSGTAALHCAVAGLGVKPGDEVLVPAYTFIASAMAVFHQNAVPVFVDIDPDTFLMDPGKIEEKITSRTRAIMAVHIYGLPCDMDAINAIARKHDLKVIEDAAQCYGSLYKGRKTGVLADAAGFSMSPTKQLTTGEGGMMTTNRGEVYELASKVRLFGELADMRSPDRAYLSEQIGWNYKLAEPLSALARVKLRHLDELIGGLQKNAENLTRQLQDINGLITPVVPPDRTHSYYLYPVRVDPAVLNLDIEVGKLRNAIMHALAAENVLVILWQKVPVPGQPMFQNKLAYGKGCPWSCQAADQRCYEVRDYPNTIRVLEDHFLLKGLIPPNGSELMARYGDAFRKVFQRLDHVIEHYDQTHQYVPVEERMG